MSKNEAYGTEKAGSSFEMRAMVLNGVNYSNWKIIMQAILQAKGLWQLCIKQTIDADEATLKKIAEAKAIMYSALSPAQLTATGSCETSYDLWLKIQENCQGAQQTLKNNAISELLGFKHRPGENIVEYCGRFEGALGRVEATGRQVEEDMRLWAFKKSLPREIRKDISTWSTANPKGKLVELISHLKTDFHEEHDDEDESGVALYSRQGKPKGRPQNKPERSDNSDITCTYCKKKGHKWKDCYKLKSDNSRKKKFANKRRPEFANMAVESPFKHPKGFKTINNNYAWIIDSGASSHMTPTKNLLRDIKYFDQPSHVFMGDGDPLKAYGEGTLCFKVDGKFGTLERVLWVPKLRQNLLSVSKANQQGYQVTFDRKHVIISKVGGPKLIGAEHGTRLYRITLIPARNDRRTEAEMAFIGSTLEEWHQRFAHCGMDAIKEMIRHESAEGLKVTSRSQNQCIDCIMGKRCRTSHPVRSEIKGSATSVVLHMDTCGPIKEPSIGGNKYFVLATEEYSGYKLIRFARNKGNIASLTKGIINRVELETKKQVKLLVTDNGTEFVNLQLSKWLIDKGINHELTAPYTPEQNGIAERANRTIIEGTRTLLLASQLPVKLWAEAALTVVYTTNRTPSTRDKSKTKYELYFGVKPDVGNLRIFGQYAVVHVPKAKRVSKWESAGKIYRFIGYGDRYNTYRFYDEFMPRVFVSCDAKFLNTPVNKPGAKIQKQDAYVTLGHTSSKEDPIGEISFAESDPNTSQTSKITTQTDISRNNLNESSKDADTSTSSAQQAAGTSVSTNHESSISSLEVSSQKSTPDRNTSSRSNINDAIHNEMMQRRGNNHQNKDDSLFRRVTRSMTNSLAPIFKDPNVVDLNTVDIDKLYESIDEEEQEEAMLCLEHESPELALFTLDDEPRTLNDAKESPEWARWKKAMDEELEALEKNDTWEVVNRPRGIKPVKNKWVFKVKLNPDGTVERYKARLVAKGYSQVPNVDYKETFAPVASMNTVRILFAAANQFDMEIRQFDVKTAFLHGDLEETIYMELPEGHPNTENKVCRLKKSLYGLKQAPRQWNIKFHNFLKEFNLQRSIVDKCLYFNNERTIFLTIYVDDGVVATSDRKLSDRLVEYLRKNFELKVMDCESFLGFQVIRDKKKKTIQLKQAHYVDKILERFGMQNCNPIGTPEEVGVVDTSKSPKLGPEYPFKEAIGSLLYLVTCTRPDIAHAVSVASRTSEPTVAHWKMIKRILRYLKDTKDYGICFRWEKSTELVGYSDADYANDVETRRSTTGYCIMYSGAPIAWRCQRQAIVSLSTTEAEYISGCELVKELLPIREMMIEMGLIEDLPTRVLVDNQSTVNIARNEGGQQRTKHIDVRRRWLNEQHLNRKIQVDFIPGKEQAADILTKPLHKTKFAQNRSLLLSAIMTFIMIIMLGLISLAEGYNFQETAPAYYKPSEYQYFQETRDFDLDITIASPCKTYFRDITTDLTTNTLLISDCEEEFREKTKGMMKNCKSFNDTAVVSKREKRFIPALLAVGYFVLAGAETYSVIKTHETTINIQELASAQNEVKKFLEQSYKAFNTTRNTIQHITERIDAIELKLASLDKKIDSMPRITSLVYDYHDKFDDFSRHLHQIDGDVEYRHISPQLMDLVGNHTLWKEPASKWSTLTKCEHRSTKEGHFNIKLRFTVPVRDESVRILREHSFRFWNYTNNVYCWMRYTGPKLVLHNMTNNCFLEIQSYWIDDQSLMGHNCAQENLEIDRSRKSMFQQLKCKKEFTPSMDDVQIQRDDGFVKTYCFGQNITIKNQVHPCPDKVFELPASESFSIGLFYYRQKHEKLTFVNPVDIQTSRQLSKQLRLNEFKISGTNLTQLNREMDLLGSMMNTISRNLTLSQVNLPDLLTSPLKGLTNMFSGIWHFIEKGMVIIAGIAILFLLLLTAPLIELVFSVLKMMKNLAFYIIRRRHTSITGIRIRARKRNKHWDDSYIIPEKDQA